MPTFPKGFHAFQLRLANAQRIARLTESAPAPHVSSSFSFPDPVDLRGIPAIGRGVGGTIPGTQPENAVAR